MTSIINNNFVQAYLEANKSLIRTMVVKSNFAVIAMNKSVRDAHGDLAVNSLQPGTWKYYMNVAGEYHFTDTPMYVISLDTKETILFSPQTLKFHTATAAAYADGTRYYLALVNEYPEQKFLINCILHPADKQYAIDSDQGTILTYDPSLVEENESTLIMELENFIKSFLARSYVEAFTLTDEYYGFMNWMIVGQQALLKLLNLRVKRCKTEEVHSFHLREYLASHHRLDRWLPYLLREQALWLYRNIRFIERNAGKMEIFKSLIANILDKRQIPLNEFTVRQLADFDSQGYPITMARRKQIGATPNSAQTDSITLAALYAQEALTAYGNETFMAGNKERVDHKLQTHSSSVLQTKDLESAMVDLSNAVPDPLPEVMMRQWVAMTHMGLYNISVNFQDPKTTTEYSLSSWDAIIYMIYLTCHSNKIPFTSVPAYANIKYRLHPRPNVTDLTRVIEPGMEWLEPIAEELVKGQPILTECTSVTMFHDMTTQVYEECLRHWFLLADTHDIYARGVLEQMILKLFGASLRDFSLGELTETWRVRLNLPRYDYTYDEAQDLIQEIFSKATGHTVDSTRSLRQIQRAMLNLFETLSSYSIQIFKDINDGDLILAGGSGIRCGNVREFSQDVVRAIISTRVEDVGNVVVDETDGMNELDRDFAVDSQIKTDYGDIEISTTIDIYVNTDIQEYAYTLGHSLTVGSSFIDPVTGNTVDSSDFQLENYLTQKQLKSLANSEIFI